MKTSIGTEIPEFIDKKKGREKLLEYIGELSELQRVIVKITKGGDKS